MILLTHMTDVNQPKPNSEEVAEMLLMQHGHDILAAMRGGAKEHPNGVAHLLKAQSGALMPDQIEDIASQLFPELAKHAEHLDEGIETLDGVIPEMQARTLADDDEQFALEQNIAAHVISLFKGALDAKRHELAFDILKKYEDPYLDFSAPEEGDVGKLSLELCTAAIDAGKLDLANDIEDEFAGKFWEDRDIGLTMRRIHKEALSAGNVDLAQKIIAHKAGALLDDMLE